MQENAKLRVNHRPLKESGGVIAMIDLLIGDLQKEMTEATTEENNSQGDYEVIEIAL